MNKTVTKVLNIVLILVMIAALASPLIGTAFTYPSEDDFSYESGGSAGAAEFGSSIKQNRAATQLCFWIIS